MTNVFRDIVAPSRTVLFVEDEFHIRECMAEFLRENGYRVLEAADAQEALSTLEAEASVDVVFADIMMPGAMNGLALARRIRATHPRMQIVLTSGVPLSFGLAAGLADGDLILAKPYNHDDLLSHIDLAWSKSWQGEGAPPAVKSDQ
ncbi:MAG TPA: response regulator [Beijerinckiaceae bacterium]|jgi:CheY-like chemotaxis protein|nr:response regulator [Beijerinckiaceae bacterium]